MNKNSISPCDLDNVSTALVFIGHHLHDQQAEMQKERVIDGAGHLCKLLAREVREMTLQLDEPNMTGEDIRRGRPKLFAQNQVISQGAGLRSGPFLKLLWGTDGG